MSHTEIHINEPGASIEERVAALEKQVEFLSKDRPGRKMKPNITSQPGVCGIDPARDSSICPDASIYRYQNGCQGDKCVQINRDYYSDYRAKRRQNTEPTAEAVVEDLPASVSNGEASHEPPSMTPPPPAPFGLDID